MRKVVITGMGIASPLGCSLDEFWERMIAGQSGVVALIDDKFQGLPSRIGALVQGYHERDYFDTKQLRRISRTSQLAIVAADQAIADAGLLEPQVNRDEVGVIIGSSIGGFCASDPYFEDYYVREKIGPMIIPLSMNIGPASNISIRYNFKGPLLALDAACASGPHAVGYAYNLIRMGLLDIAVTGGADSSFSPAVLAAWGALKALSIRNDDPSKACRPFSADRDGLVLGEGAGILVLESESSARKRNRQIWGEIVGYGSTSDGLHITQPGHEGPSRAMQLALKDAKLLTTSIDYINAHGTGTHLNDPNETNAIKQVFGSYSYEIPVVSNKAALGHSIGASGALEIISCILSLQHQKIPPTISYQIPDPECDLDYVTEGSRSCKLVNILSNSFAFGGSNAVIIISKYESA